MATPNRSRRRTSSKTSDGSGKLLNHLRYAGKNLVYARDKQGKIIRDSNGNPLTVAQIESGVTSATQKRGPGIGKKPSVRTDSEPEKSNIKGVSYNNDIARLRREQEAARQAQLAKAERKPPAPKPPTPKPAASQQSRPAATRPATPAAPKKPAAPASPKDRRVSAATANRESGNYGTSRTNNPMIDDAMKARMRQREERAGVGPVKDGARYAADVKNSTKGVGPVKDGGRYASNLKPSKKTKPEKKMTLAERMRRRRQGLA